MEKILENIKKALVALFGFTDAVEQIMPLKKSSSKKASVKRKASRKKR